MTDIYYTLGQAFIILSRRWIASGSKNFQIAGDLRDSFEIYLLRLQDRLWNGQFIQSSAGHFRQLGIRHLGLFCREYIETGYGLRLHTSLDFALKSFSREGRMTARVWPNSKAYDVFGYSSDTLPLVLWSLEKLGAKELFHRHRELIKAECVRYQEVCFDAEDAYPKKNVGLRDLKVSIKRRSSFYSFCMGFLLDRLRSHWGLGSRWHSEAEWKAELQKRYFSEEAFFFEDLEKISVLSADAQLIAYWLELLDLDESWDRVWNTILSSSLARPLLIRQSSKRMADRERFLFRMTVPNYQGDTIHSDMAAMALCLGFRSGKDLREYLDLWADLSFRDGELMEVYDDLLNPYRSFFYKSDEGMSWSIGFLSALRELKQSFPPDPPECD